MQRPADSSREPIHGIQYLRGLAAMMVALHHARDFFGPAVSGWSQAGAAGVDIFFVISGFIMAHATMGYDPAQSRVRQAGAFLGNRFVRVVPLYWLAVLGYAVIGAYLAQPDLWKDFVFWPRPNFAHRSMYWPALIPGWTINYEVAFYLLFAASMLAGPWRLRCATTALLVLATLGIAVGPADPMAAFYTSSVLIEFALGIGIHAVLQRWRPRVPAPALGLIFVLSFAILLLRNGGIARGLADGLPSAAIVWSAVLLFQGWRNRTLHLIGDASYSIYLWHMLALRISGRICRMLGWTSPTPEHVMLVFATGLAVSVVGGIVLHLVLEKPLIRFVRRLSGTRRPQTTRALEPT